MGRGIYGTTGTAKLIYGISPRNNCNQADTCLTGPTMTAFLGLLGELRHTVEFLFPTMTARAPFVAEMSARGYIPASYFVRYAWRQKYSGVVWTGTCIQAGQLKDLYLELGLDFSTDAYVRDYDKVFGQRDLQTGQDGSPTENQASNAEAVNT